MGTLYMQLIKYSSATLSTVGQFENLCASILNINICYFYLFEKKENIYFQMEPYGFKLKYFSCSCYTISSINHSRELISADCVKCLMTYS